MYASPIKRVVGFVFSFSAFFSSYFVLFSQSQPIVILKTSNIQVKNDTNLICTVSILVGKLCMQHNVAHAIWVQSIQLSICNNNIMQNVKMHGTERNAWHGEKKIRIHKTTDLICCTFCSSILFYLSLSLSLCFLLPSLLWSHSTAVLSHTHDESK